MRRYVPQIAVARSGRRLSGELIFSGAPLSILLSPFVDISEICLRPRDKQKRLKQREPPRKTETKQGNYRIPLFRMFRMETTAYQAWKI